jgi:L-ascorbate metabolism protein UlaG (beta-lactamase superfamily)
MQITWLGHGTTQFRFASGEVLIFDPWTENPKFPKNYKFDRIDAIAVSHGHFDHISSVIPLAKQFSPKVVAIFESATWLESKGVKNTTGMNKGGTVDLGFVKLTMTHAIHSCGILDDGKIIYGGEAAGYVVTPRQGPRIYMAGDTNVFSDMALIQQLYEPELALLPIGDLFTMSPHEAAKAVELLKVKKVIPMHFGTFPALTGTPEELAQKLKGTATEVWTLEPGKPVEYKPPSGGHTPQTL